jgi:hypothetical protein
MMLPSVALESATVADLNSSEIVVGSATIFPALRFDAQLVRRQFADLLSSFPHE